MLIPFLNTWQTYCGTNFRFLKAPISQEVTKSPFILLHRFVSEAHKAKSYNYRMEAHSNKQPSLPPHTSSPHPNPPTKDDLISQIQTVAHQSWISSRLDQAVAYL